MLDTVLAIIEYIGVVSFAISGAIMAIDKENDFVGVIFLAWPQSQTKPDGETNRAVLNEHNIRIIKVEQVQVDDKNKLVEGSAIEIEL